MVFLRLLPAILSSLVLAAHFFRMGSLLLVLFALVLPWLLFFPSRWAARVVQVALIYGAFEWIRTLFVFVSDRMDAGQPYTRLAIILGVVAVFTLGAALSFSLSPALRKRYGLDGPGAEEEHRSVPDGKEVHRRRYDQGAEVTRRKI